MLGRSSRLAAMAAMVLGSGIALAPPGPVSGGPQAFADSVNSTARSAIQKFGAPSFMEALRAMAPVRGQRGGTPGQWKYPKPGHTVRQGQRMARKRRNVLSNRRAHRA